MEGIHLVIFCKNTNYSHFLNHCTFSINENVKDKIVTKTIVTDKKFPYLGFDVVEDREIWELFDSKFEYKNLYNDSWYRQQILKLSSNLIKDGDILIVDADLLFLKPVQFVEQGKYNFYMADEYDKRYFNTINRILNIEKQVDDSFPSSFVSDFSIFNSDILKSLQLEIEEKNKKNWLEVLNNILPNSIIRKLPTQTGFLLSEYELYGNFFLSRHKEKLNELIQPIGYNSVLSVKSPCHILEESKFSYYIKKVSKNYYQCVNITSNENL